MSIALVEQLQLFIYLAEILIYKYIHECTLLWEMMKELVHKRVK